MMGIMARRTRQNHGLEHGTVAILMGRGMRPPLGGYSTPGGFFIVGRATTEDVASAAGDALAQMKAGHRELAVSPYCGTNLATGALLAALISAAIMRGSRSRARRMRAAALAAIGATLGGRPLGQVLQRHFTTLADVDDLRITGIRRLLSGRFTLHRVSTSVD